MKDFLRNKIDSIIKKEFKISDVEYDILIPERKEFGDFSTNIAFVLAKQLANSKNSGKSVKNPKEIADIIIKKIVFSEIDKCELAGGGFINFFMSSDVYIKELNIILKEKSKYGSSDIGKNKKIQLEFISANPTGPMTMGNGRGGFSGDTLANILKKNGFDARREFYVNDAGNQVKNILAKSIYVSLGVSVDLVEGEDIYGGDYIEYVSRKIKKQKGIDWINCNMQKTGEMAAKIILEDFIKKDVKFFGIKYDRWFSEKSLYTGGIIEKMWKYLKSKKLIYEKDLAYWLKTSEYGDEKDRVIRKSNGEFTYLMSDIAYLYERFSMRKFNKVIMILGADHHGYIDRFQAVCEMLGHKGKLDIILTQFVRLVRGGEEVKMSKRKGTFVTLREAVEDLGVEAARYFFISRDFNTHIDIDLDIAKAQNSKNPIYYIQYASARINSVQNKVKSQKSKVKNKVSLRDNIIFDQYELAVVKKLSQYPELIKEAGESYEVYRLAKYIHELSSDFHKFYENCKIIGDDKETLRVKIIKATGIVLEDALKNMGIEAAKNM